MSNTTPFIRPRMITVVLVGCFALTCTAAYFLSNSHEEPPDPVTTLTKAITPVITPTQEAVSGEVHNTAPTPRERQWSSIPLVLCNGIATYRFETHSAYSASEGLAAKSPEEMLLSAEMIRTLVTFDDSGYVIANRMRIDQEAELVLYGFYSSEGTLERLYVNREMKMSPVVSIAKSLLHAFQVTLRAENQYELQEVSSNGFATARYERIGLSELSKTIVTVTPFEAVGGRTIDVLDSTIDIHLNDAGLVEQMSVKEQLKLALTATDWITSNASLVYQLEHLQRGTTARSCERPVDQVLRELKLVRLALHLVGPNTGNTSRSTEPVENSLRRFRALLEKPELEDEEETERNLLLDMIARRLATHPEEIASVVHEILSSRDHVPYAQALIGGLAGADTEPSQTALLSLIQELDTEGETDLLHHAMRAHQFLNHPSPENIRYMLGLYEDASHDLSTREVALLAVGSAATKLTEAEQQGYYARVLMERADGADSVREQLIAIAALGNQGSPDAVEFLKSRVADSDPDIAAFAVDSLRHIPTDDVEPFLLDLITAQEQNSRLAYQAVIALDARPLEGETLEGLIAFYLQGRRARLSEDTVYRALLEILAAPERSTRPEVHDFRETIFARDTLTGAELRLLGPYRGPRR